MKTLQKIEDLALCGAPPLFEAPLLVGRPNVGDRAVFLRHLEGALDRRWLSNFGPLVKEFEKRLAQHLGVRHAITVCNATVGLEIAVRALELSGEVIVPSFTFIATVHALHWLGLQPVFVDVDPATHNLDVAAVSRAITAKTSGIIGVHVWGRGCNPDALEMLASEHGLRLFFDAAHAFSCSHRGRMIGGFGQCEVFSFHATKFFNTFEGGCITTNDDALADRLRLMSNFGFRGVDDTACVGTNGKMTEASAAMGLANLESIDRFIEINRANYHVYRDRLAVIPGLRCIAYDERERCNYQYVVVEVDEPRFGLPRDGLCRLLQAENIVVRRYFYPGCHRMEPYRSSPVATRFPLPHTDSLCERILIFPTGTQLVPADIARICSWVASAQEHADDLAGPVLAR